MHYLVHTGANGLAQTLSSRGAGPPPPPTAASWPPAPSPYANRADAVDSIWELLFGTAVGGCNTDGSYYTLRSGWPRSQFDDLPLTQPFPNGTTNPTPNFRSTGDRKHAAAVADWKRRQHCGHRSGVRLLAGGRGDSVSYAEFLADKAKLADPGGFEPVNLPAHLFDYQTNLVEWAVRGNHGGIFADCGLGKTPMALAWADQIHRHTGKPVLFSPLLAASAVATEAEKFAMMLRALSRTMRRSRRTHGTNTAWCATSPRSRGAGAPSVTGSSCSTVPAPRTTPPAAPRTTIEPGTVRGALDTLGHSDIRTSRCSAHPQPPGGPAVAAIWRAKRRVATLKRAIAEPPCGWVSSSRARAGSADRRTHRMDSRRSTSPARSWIVRETKVEAHRPAKGTLLTFRRMDFVRSVKKNRRSTVER